MPDYPFALPCPGALIPLRQALVDVELLAEYFDTLDPEQKVRSRAAIHGYAANHLRYADVLGASEDTIRTLRRLRSVHLHKRRGYILGSVRLAEHAPWWVVIREVIAWDRRAQSRWRRGTTEWAVLLGDRLLIWILLFGGPRVENLARLCVGGEGSRLVRDAAGRIQQILLPESETKNNRRVRIPIGDIPGIAELAQVYVDEGRPLLLRGHPDPPLEVFLRPNGNPFAPVTLAQYFARKVRPGVFGSLRVTMQYLRRICVALLHEAYGLSFKATAAILGHTRETSEHIYYILSPDAVTAEYSAAIKGEPATLPHIADAVMELRAYLAALAIELRR